MFTRIPKSFLICLFLVILIILFNLGGYLNFLRNAFYQLVLPLEKSIYQFSYQIKEWTEVLTNLKKTKEEISRLKEENLQLQSQINQLREIAQENQFLRKQLNLSQSLEKKLVLAQVVGSQIENFNQVIFINKGKKAGIKKNQPVIIAGNILIGQIIESFDSFSKVLLINSPQSKINVMIQDKTSEPIQGILKGSSDFRLILDLIPQGKKLKENQIIATSGLAGFYPPNLLIGRIKKIISTEENVFQQAEIEPIADLNHLKLVFVLIE